MEERFRKCELEDLSVLKNDLMNKYKSVKGNYTPCSDIVSLEEIKVLLNEMENSDNIDVVFDYYMLLMGYIKKYNNQLSNEKMSWNKIE